MKKRILILGSTGMLGSMVFHYFKNSTKHTVIGTKRGKITQKKGLMIKRFDAKEFNSNPEKYSYIKKFDYIINCIGIIKPFCRDNDPLGVNNAIQINAFFPHRLSHYLYKTRVKLIQIATDCVYSGSKGMYKEWDNHDPTDVYGMTKSLGEVVDSSNFLNVRCSLIGPELKQRLNLLEWFLNSQEGATLTGYTHHRWNGVTTLQFAELCRIIIDTDQFDSIRKVHHTHHFHPNTAVNKYELLNNFKEIFNKHVFICKQNKFSPSIDRTLSSEYNFFSALYKHSTMKSAIKRLRTYIIRNNFYQK